ncbi:MAG: type I-E CRISPR-associated protein Cas6/Cse3/CasE [Ruminococcus sp.]|nr:type I-E CRISPR-associated protein Cas6/Cse3/CasE [Ruminococcus sp.]
MYLSRMKLDLSRRQTMKALASPNLFHGAIESCETEGRTRKLWRIDTLGGAPYLLILSEQKLDFSPAAQQFCTDTAVESKCYDQFLERITEGSRWRFRLCANPTIQRKCGDERGKVMAHITAAFQEEWLKKQAKKHGFSLNAEEFLVTGSQWYNFRKGSDRQNVRMLAVTYEGILTVMDADAFRKALTQGIGREKAYGMGLLTIAGIR